MVVECNVPCKHFCSIHYGKSFTIAFFFCFQELVSQTLKSHFRGAGSPLTAYTGECADCKTTQEVISKNLKGFYLCMSGHKIFILEMRGSKDFGSRFCENEFYMKE